MKKNTATLGANPKFNMENTPLHEEDLGNADELDCERKKQQKTKNKKTTKHEKNNDDDRGEGN